MHDYLSKYDSLAEEDQWIGIPGRKEWILNQIGKGKRVLDVGCLGGKLSQNIARAGNEVWGVEVNPYSARLAEKRGIQVKVADVEDGLPFDSAQFDVVHAGGVMSHLYDTKGFFEEVRRVLKPDGVFLFVAPNLNSLENRFKVFMGGYLSEAGAYPEDHHGSRIRFYNLEKIRELCGATRFRVEDAQGLALQDLPEGMPSALKGVLSHFSRPIEKYFPQAATLLMIKARPFTGN